MIRNVELSASFSTEERQQIESKLSTNATVGWGPIAVSGSYSESSSRKHYKATFDGVTFKIQQPQIIARTGTMLPRCPNPDKTLSWQGDEILEPKRTDQWTKHITEARRRDYEQLYYEEQILHIENEASVVRDEWLQNRIRGIRNPTVPESEDGVKTLAVQPGGDGRDGRDEGDGIVTKDSESRRSEVSTEETHA